MIDCGVYSNKIIMQGVIRDDKNYDSPIRNNNSGLDAEKDRKIRRLTQINKQLIETLKEQNQQLSRRIAKQKVRPPKTSARSTSLKNPSRSQTKQLESIRKELSNAYRQIDMYRENVQKLKAKEVSLDHVQKIKELENRVRQEDLAIQNYQKEIRYLSVIREKQQKELQVYENAEIRQTKVSLEKQVGQLKERLKTIKKAASRREEIQKRQHTYYVELEKAMRMADDKYYAGKIEPKEEPQHVDEVSEQEWMTVKSKLYELRKDYQENNKKLDQLGRQKLRELKSYQQNQLKLKEKMRKLNTLKNRIAELTKLTIDRGPPKEPKLQPLPKKEEIKNDKNRSMVVEREVKKWNMPAAFCLQKGKVLPNSQFVSDKSRLDSQRKYKIIEATVWTDPSGVPCLLQFSYQDQQGQRTEGREMMENPPSSLQPTVIRLKEKDYIFQISGRFTGGLLTALTLRSKLGQQASFEDPTAVAPSESFSFYSQPNDIPSCFYGATIAPTASQVRICYLGCQFMSDW